MKRIIKTIRLKCLIRLNAFPSKSSRINSQTACIFSCVLFSIYLRFVLSIYIQLKSNISCFGVTSLSTCNALKFVISNNSVFWKWKICLEKSPWNNLIDSNLKCPLMLASCFLFVALSILLLWLTNCLNFYIFNCTK